VKEIFKHPFVMLYLITILTFFFSILLILIIRGKLTVRTKWGTIQNDDVLKRYKRKTDIISKADHIILCRELEEINEKIYWLKISMRENIKQVLLSAITECHKIHLDYSTKKIIEYYKKTKKIMKTNVRQTYAFLYAEKVLDECDKKTTPEIERFLFLENNICGVSLDTYHQKKEILLKKLVSLGLETFNNMFDEEKMGFKYENVVNDIKNNIDQEFKLVDQMLDDCRNINMSKFKEMMKLEERKKEILEYSIGEEA
jgi:hypothetical protein